jgi:hypothetical protein
MKISPIAQSSGQPGESLSSVNTGRTADPIKMERARAIARGEKVAEQSGDQQADRVQQDVRKLKMRTNFSTDRDAPALEAVAPPTETAQSSTEDTSEPGAVEATQPLSPQFAALAKQKRALQVKERELLEREKALTANPTTGDAELIARLKSKPLSVLQEHGVTYDQLTEEILNGQGHNPEIQALKEEIAALKKGVDSQFQTREEQQEEAALTEMLYEAEGLAKDGDAFEMIRTEDAYDEVLRLIHSTYKKTGRVLDVQEAMNTVENRLLARAEKLASINKVRAKIAPPESTQLQPQQKPQGMRTLTARDTATPVMDRRARAIAAAMGTLKR